MSIIQHNNEIRYIRRQNLREEARIMRNYYRDVIHSYGIDCNYYKIKIPYPEIFSKVVDQNNIILHAYGYDVNPDYSISANMITYMEVENDIFQLNKFGIMPNTDVNFYFDAIEFAANLAYKLGKYREYKLKNTKSYVLDLSKENIDNLVLSIPFECDILTGTVDIPLDNIDVKLDTDYTVKAFPSKIENIEYSFPVNEDIYKSFNYDVIGNSLDDNAMQFGFRVSKNESNSYILSGSLSGAVIFHDLNKIGKYMELIMPEVGDIITIDFPNSESREQYEITDCIDKNLANDGLNPLMHKYIWKCKARRYINSQEEFPENNFANDKLNEKLDLMNTSLENISKDISIYDNNEDDVYGGYERPQKFNDLKIYHINKNKLISEENIDNGYMFNLMIFANGDKLMTDGYNLYFSNNGNAIQLSFIPSDTIVSEETLKNLILKLDLDLEKNKEYVELDDSMKFLKATDDILMFINIDNEIFRLCDNTVANFSIEEEKLKVKNDKINEFKNNDSNQISLDSLEFLTKYDDQQYNFNFDGDSYYKFANCRTILFSCDGHLYCNLGNTEVPTIELA